MALFNLVYGLLLVLTGVVTLGALILVVTDFLAARLWPSDATPSVPRAVARVVRR